MPAGRTALVALLTLLVLAGLAFGAYWLLAGGPSNSVTVPSVLGSTRQAAEQELRRRRPAAGLPQCGRAR